MVNEVQRGNGGAQGSDSTRPLRQGKLIVLEGIDLSGRTTQGQLLYEWLRTQHYAVTRTALRTSPLISDVLARARAGSALQPMTYSLLYCADHLDRTQHVMRPALERGEIVLADRYTYTAFARDAARGLDPAWIRKLYRFSIQPDAIFYLHISPEEAVKRRLALYQSRQPELNKRMTVQEQKLAKRKGGKKDKQKRKAEKVQRSLPAREPLATPTFTPETLENFRLFESKMYREYQQMQIEFGFSVIEGAQSIEQVQATLRRAMLRLLERA